MLFCFFCFHLFLLLILLLRSVARFIRWSSNKSCRFAHVRIQLGLVLHHVVGQRSSVAHSIAVTEMSELPIYCEGVIDGVKDPARAGQVVSEYVRSLSPCLSLQ